MDFDKKKILVVLGIVLAIIVVGLVIGFAVKKIGVPAGPAASSSEPMYNGRPLNELYNPEVPSNAAPTEAKQVGPASPDKSITIQSRLYDISASTQGFSPDTLTVNEYDTVRINFTAVDGAYDFSIPYLGVGFAPVPKGTTKLLVFTASGAGTFSFECGNACPASGKIKGSIIIIPYKNSQ